jgi:hypothetical protein
MTALPAFITKGTKVKLKTARRRVSKAAERFTGGFGQAIMFPFVFDGRKIAQVRVAA